MNREVAPGDNNPPEMLEIARQATRSISEWFAEHPVIASEEEAREIKLQIDRAKLCLRDLEDDRDQKVRPLNEQVNAINSGHRAVRRPLGTLLDHMLEALDLFIKGEEVKRIEAAMEAQRKAREAEEAAREAERLEREQIENAQLGEVGVDIAAAVQEADEAFRDFEKAERDALRAIKDAKVKIAGGFTRAITIKEREVLNVDDAAAAILDMGLSDGVKNAILTSARSFRRLHNRLPNGVSATIERNAR